MHIEIKWKPVQKVVDKGGLSVYTYHKYSLDVSRPARVYVLISNITDTQHPRLVARGPLTVSNEVCVAHLPPGCRSCDWFPLRRRCLMAAGREGRTRWASRRGDTTVTPPDTTSLWRCTKPRTKTACMSLTYSYIHLVQYQMYFDHIAKIYYYHYYV